MSLSKCVSRPSVSKIAAAGLVSLGLMLSSTAAMAQYTPVEIEAGDSTLFSSRVLSTGLANPWAMVWGPDDLIWLTERNAAQVTRVNPTTGVKQVLLKIDGVYTGAQHEGLLGLALHPELLKGTGNDYVYVVYTVNNGTAEAPDPSAQLVRYTYDEATQQLGEPLELISGIPAWNDHNAGRLVIGSDLKIYYSLGEQGGNQGRNYHRPIRAQQLPTKAEVDAGDWNAYTGKVLRLELDGSIPADNPEIEGVRSHIYTYGHRNPQGIAFGRNDILYSAEHGPSSDDEINILVPGGNYGWPNVSGYVDDSAYVFANWAEAPAGIERSNVIPPEVPQYIESEFAGEVVEPIAAYFTVETGYEFGAQCGFICNPTIAPGAVAYYEAGENGIEEWDNSLLLPTLKNGALYVQKLSEDGLAAEGLPTEWFNTQNRYRDVLVSPDGRSVFIATDGFGSAAAKFGPEPTTSVMHNPGAILLFTYGGSDGAGVALSSGAAEATKTAEAVPVEAAAPAADLTLEELMAQGQSKFNLKCSACHGAAGEGGVGLKLAGNAKLENADYITNVVLKGFGYMPPFSSLTDTDVAEIATYIRNSWGNSYPAVQPSQVAAAR